MAPGSSQLHVLWLLPTLVAATFDTLADLISDEVVAGEDDSSDDDDEPLLAPVGGAKQLPAGRPCCCPRIPTRQKLTGEQDFMVSMVPMVAASLAILLSSSTCFEQPLAAVARSDVGSVAAAAGVAYAVGYLALLKAWEMVPSTVIVPCLQLSSPMVELLEAALAPFHSAHPVLAPLSVGASLSAGSCVAFALVFVGGVLPSVDGGAVAELCSLELWRQESMRWMMLGNIAFAVFYVLMGLATSERAPERMSSAQFMASTNLVAVISFSCYVATSRRLRRQFARAYGLRRCGASARTARVHWLARVLSMTAESSNYVAMFAISIAFGLHANAGLVAAARASLNQVTNCVLGAVLYRCYHFGRPVEQLGLKLLSCARTLPNLQQPDAPKRSSVRFPAGRRSLRWGC